MAGTGANTTPRHDPPVNIVGGFKFPDAPRLIWTRPMQSRYPATRWTFPTSCVARHSMRRYASPRDGGVSNRHNVIQGENFDSSCSSLVTTLVSAQVSPTISLKRTPDSRRGLLQTRTVSWQEQLPLRA
jgi:hypothetical protein